MAIQLEKKEPLSLEKNIPGLSTIVAGLGWDPAEINGYAVDLDLSLFMMGANGKLVEEEFFVFYNNNTSSDGAAFYPGDSRAGEGQGDDEVINIDLHKIDNRVEFLYFAVTIDQSEARAHHFGHVQNAYFNIRSGSGNAVLCQYQLNESFVQEDSLIIAAISRNGGAWDVEALGQAFSGGLEALIELYQ